MSILQPLIEPEHHRKMALIATNCTNSVSSASMFAFPFQFISLHYHFHFNFICGLATHPTHCTSQIRLHLKIDFKPLQCQPFGRKASEKETDKSCLRSRLLKMKLMQTNWMGRLIELRYMLHVVYTEQFNKAVSELNFNNISSSQTKRRAVVVLDWTMDSAKRKGIIIHRRIRKRKSKQFIFHRFNAMAIYDWTK